MGSNMMPDLFMQEAPVAVATKPRSASDRGPGRDRISISSFNHENFGDWGSFNYESESNHLRDAKIEDPNSDKKLEASVDGFNVIDRKTCATAFPKLAASKREVKKVTAENVLPSLIIQDDALLSPITLGSPENNLKTVGSRFGEEPIQGITRSMSDQGHFLLTETTDDLNSRSPSTSFRSMFRDQLGGEISLSFNEGRKPVSNRALLKQIEEVKPQEPKPKRKTPNRALLKQIKEKKNAYGNLKDDEDEEPKPKRKSPNFALLKQIKEKKKAYGNLMDEEDGEAKPQRKTPSRNRSFLRQIGERKKSYRGLTLDDDDEPTRTPAKRSLFMQVGERKKSYRTLMLEDDDDEEEPLKPEMEKPSYDQEPFEGTLPLKAESEPVAVKKRSSSRDRLNKVRSEEPDIDEFDSQRPDRKSSFRQPSRKMSLSDSNRSGGTTKSSKSITKRIPKANSEDLDFYEQPSSSPRGRGSTKRLSRPKNDETEFYEVRPSSTKSASALSSGPERESLAADVQRMRSSREKGVRRSSSGKSLKSTSGESKQSSKKKMHRESSGALDDSKKYKNRCKNRQSGARRASMTGNIVDMDDEPPREKRRSSMDHLKSNASLGRPKETTKRRASMDHFRHSPSISPPKNRKASSDIDLASHVESKELSSRVPFGDEITETTKDTEESHDHDINSRGKEGSKDRLSNSVKRRIGRSKSGKERQGSRNRLSKTKDKSVTVAEILGFVASVTHSHKKPSNGRARRSRVSNSDSFDVSNRSGGTLDVSNRSGGTFSAFGNGSFNASSKSTNSRGRNSRSGSPRRRKSRSRSRQRDSSRSFNGIRKGKRGENHVDESPRKEGSWRKKKQAPDEEPEKEGSWRKKKEKPIVVGKEGRHRWGGRRGSAR